MSNACSGSKILLMETAENTAVEFVLESGGGSDSQLSMTRYFQWVRDLARGNSQTLCQGRSEQDNKHVVLCHLVCDVFEASKVRHSYRPQYMKKVTLSVQIINDVDLMSCMQWLKNQTVSLSADDVECNQIV
ncbi:hypothetical protein TNCV_2166101 [Trichonephila clavipes]|nr:hypothetical protein TNCV_2166101 [Trichonephila clavipes]